VYPDDRGTNYAVRQGEEVVEELLAPGTRTNAPSRAAVTLPGDH
jgi:hypothetical protein